MHYLKISGSARGVEIAQSAISTFSDFKTYSSINNILININWTQTENGLRVDNIKIINFVPVGVMIENVTIAEKSGHVSAYPNSDDWVGINGNQPGILTMDLNAYLSDNQDSILNVELNISGATVSSPEKSVFFPAGKLPNSGITIVR
jgi:hypothetical protein